MKTIFFLSILFITLIPLLQGLINEPTEYVVITSHEQETRVFTNDNGQLHVDVSSDDARRLKVSGLVRCGDFGAVGDSKTDE